MKSKIQHALVYFLFTCLFWNCNGTIKPSQSNESESSYSDKQPVFSPEDEKFANVYKLLDGTWKGEFTILEDPNPKNVKEVDLKNLTLAQVKSPALKTINKIEVTQVYHSETPYFQRVTITDFYPDSNKKEVSQGVNKIENGKMWCIVNKPGETVVHHGSTRGPKTIIWQQSHASPQKIEYFQETVDENFYEIIGYGYYTGDNTDLSPKLWFYGKYERQ